MLKRLDINYYNFSGAIGFDKTDGFWLITSLPKFPSPKADGYKFPSNGDVYGQTFLCISMNYDMLDIVGEFDVNYKSNKCKTKNITLSVQFLNSIEKSQK